MKPEPLKGKITQAENPEMDCQRDMFLKEDIKSAVEWLKQRVKEDYERNNNVRDLESDSLYDTEILDLIDEAFEDVKGA